MKVGNRVLTKKVPLLDLTAQYATIRQDIQSAIAEVASEQKFILGPRVEKFEEEIAHHCGSRFACGVSSGSDALLVALMAEGVGPEDEVITTAYSFFATAGSIARLGARPSFVDIDPETFNISARLIEKKITKKTKVILPVHLFGQAADMSVIMALAKKHGLIVIEDAAQAIGATHKNEAAGTFGHYGCLSFFPTKNLGGFGDGGMVITSDKDRLQKLRALRVHGEGPSTHFPLVGGNFRLDALQAAILSVKLKHLNAWTERRIQNAELYATLFDRSGLVGKEIWLPRAVEPRHIFNQFVIRARRRDELQAFLKENEVGSAVYYPKALPLLECFSSFKHKANEFPESVRAAKETLALPIFPELSEAQIERVVETISRFYTK